MKVKVLSTGYVPRELQRPLHNKMAKHNVLVIHRRFGKTVFAVNELKDRACRFQKNCPKTGKPFLNPKFAYIAPTFRQAKNIAWDYFKQFMGVIPGIRFYETDLKVTFPLNKNSTCTIYLFGTENFDNLRGLYLDGYVLDEYADMHPDVRDKVLLPTISDRDGWEIVIGTPKGDNAFKRIYDFALDEMARENKGWFAEKYNAYDTDIFSREQLDELQRQMSDEAFKQEYLCDFTAAPSGKFYQGFVDEARASGRITRVPYDPVSPVFTYWDLGFGDSTTIWFIQEVGREIRVLRYYEAHGKDLGHYVDVLNEYKEKYKYRYGTHKLPHDANHHELQTGTTRVEFLESHGLTNLDVMPKGGKNVIAERIHAGRQILPKCWFDLEGCQEGLEALSGYEREWDSKNLCWKPNPKHNWASHGSDAFGGFGLDYFPGFGQNGGGGGADVDDLYPDTIDSEYNEFDF